MLRATVEGSGEPARAHLRDHVESSVERGLCSEVWDIYIYQRRLARVPLSLRTRTFENSERVWNTTTEERDAECARTPPVFRNTTASKIDASSSTREGTFHVSDSGNDRWFQRWSGGVYFRLSSTRSISFKASRDKVSKTLSNTRTSSWDAGEARGARWGRAAAWRSCRSRASSSA